MRFTWLAVVGASIALFIPDTGFLPDTGTSVYAPMPAEGNRDGGLRRRPAALPPGQGQLDESTSSCATCHVTIHKEWAETKHAKAWVDPIYRAAIAAKKRPERCYRCHIPAGVLHLAPKKPVARTDKGTFHEGIRCADCHVRDGKVFGPFGAKTDAHPSVKSELFTGKNMDLCLSCHSTLITPVLPLGRDYAKSNMLAQNKTCFSCHMPEVERYMAVDATTKKPSGPKRKGYSHTLLGPWTPGFLATTFEFSVKKNGNKHTLVLANQAGHRVPGLKLRKFVVRFEALDGGGKSLWSTEETIDSKNVIKVQESRSVEVAAPDRTKKFRVRVRHLFKESSKAPWKDHGIAYEAELASSKDD